MRAGVPDDVTPPGIDPAACGVGFVPDGASGCDAVLPDMPCAEGQIAVPGDTVCREVAPCDAGRWGSIPLDASTEHVDRAYTGGNSDGSAARPWLSVQAGVDAASPGAIVAIADGRYAEDVAISKPVRLWGRCPAAVEIAGTGIEQAAVFIRAGADGGEVRDLAITGAAQAIIVSGSEAVRFDRLWIHHSEGVGLVAQDNLGATSVEVSGSLVEQARGIGIYNAGAAAMVEASVVRDTRPQAIDQRFGRGIAVEDHPGTTGQSQLTLQGSLVERNRENGLYVSGSDATVDSSVISDMLLQESNQMGGRGVHVNADVNGVATTALLQRSIIVRSRGAGVLVEGAVASLDRMVVRDTISEVGVTVDGTGVLALDAASGTRASVQLDASVVERNHGFGIFAMGSEAHITGVIVRDTQPRGSDQRAGRGINIQDDPGSGIRSNAEVRGSLVVNSRDGGIVLVDSDAVVDATIVRATEAQLSDGAFGDGVLVAVETGADTLMVLTRSQIERSARAGVAAFGATIDMGATLVDCNAIDLNGESFQGRDFQFSDAGGNRCGCEAVRRDCTALSSGLNAPLPL